MLSAANNYAPNELSDFVFSNSADEELLKDIVSGRQRFPVSGKNGILLFGPNGTGKSALAKLLPTFMEPGQSTNAFNINFFSIGIDESGIALTQKCSNIASRVTLDMKHHYFILDEVDNLSQNAMSALKGLMNIDNTVFIMTTNSLPKIETGVKSRSHCINMGAAAAERWLPTVKQILSDQFVCMPSDQKLLEIIAGGKGDAREIINDARRLAGKLVARGHVDQAALAAATAAQIGTTTAPSP